MGIRLDANLDFQDFTYNVLLLQKTRFYFSDEDYIYLVTKKGSSSSTNFGMAFTLNTKKDDWPVNYFGQIGWTSQTFFSFHNFQTDDLFDVKGVDLSNQAVLFTLGGYTNVLENARVLLGIRFRYNSSSKSANIDNHKNLWNNEFFLQYDFIL